MDGATCATLTRFATTDSFAGVVHTEAAFNDELLLRDATGTVCSFDPVADGPIRWGPAAPI